MRHGFTVFAALVATSLVATPMVICATQASATAEPAEIVTQAMVVAPAVATQGHETCAKKVRVVYSGYANQAAACVTPAR